MILGQDHKRLSKRHGAVSVLAYRETGFLPQALTNYLVRLGWSHGDQEIFSLDELIKLFSLEGIGKSAGVFNPEKLLWLNGHYIRGTSERALAEMTRPLLEKEGIQTEAEMLLQAVETVRERSRTLTELVEGVRFYFVDQVVYEPKAARKFLKETTEYFLQNYP